MEFTPKGHIGYHDMVKALIRASYSDLYQKPRNKKNHPEWSEAQETVRSRLLSALGNGELRVWAKDPDTKEYCSVPEWAFRTSGAEMHTKKTGRLELRDNPIPDWKRFHLRPIFVEENEFQEWLNPSSVPDQGRKTLGKTLNQEILLAFDKLHGDKEVSFEHGGLIAAARALKETKKFSDYTDNGIEKIIRPSYRALKEHQKNQPRENMN